MDTNSTYKHWYELNPSRLEIEKTVMSRLFPDFNLLSLKDGSLRWSGIITTEAKHRYNVVVEYLQQNKGEITPIIIPTLPDINGLFCGSMVNLRDTLTQPLCSNVSYLNVSCKSDNSARIGTAASTIIKAKDWFEHYEVEKDRIEKEEKKYQDSVDIKRQRVREALKNGAKIVTTPLVNFPISTEDTEEMDDSISQGEIEQLGYTVEELKKKCISYFNLLPEDEQHINIPKEQWNKYLDQLNDEYNPSLSIIDHALNASIAPSVIFNDVKELIIIDQDNPLKIFHFPLPGGGYYSFNTDCIKFRFNAKSLILFYFIKNATNFFLPLIWHSNYGYKKIIIKDLDKPKSSDIFNKDIDSKKIESLPVGIEIPHVENGNIFRFNYYYWHNWTGYVKCRVLITSLNDTELLNEKDIKIEESKVVLYRYNCHIMY